MYRRAMLEPAEPMLAAGKVLSDFVSQAGTRIGERVPIGTSAACLSNATVASPSSILCSPDISGERKSCCSGTNADERFDFGSERRVGTGALSDQRCGRCRSEQMSRPIPLAG